ncbi:CpsD/CapB family tyrosine-protein kinase [Pradoshia sp. D12]|uniref:CpsD/CapB family tyrosine-protein kinase n=1 Tax=Bacillaceae TaxID=186817 RepID=UPI00112DAFBF|nr:MULTISPECIES: CpsD/CapB family tyrosine-protein kinase [Bacillaceae]QFK72935.1 CpsD/CapB family tyrosine-protein kinase [Pradoshia sp. D12]TPF71927.1 CpsD/CapB family tyrosine-protein kinase [Bacillus sp. D12]
MARKKSKQIGNGNQRKLVTYFEQKSPISEQFRTLRTNIQFSSVDEEMQTIMITSSGPTEGKSTTAANIAVTFAQQGKRTLFIDADLRKPSSHYTFSFTNSVGLTSVLTRQIEFDKALQIVEPLGLHVLTSGPLPPNPAELLSSRAMTDLINQAKEHFDVIIVDTPPVTAVTDAQIIANLCQGVVLVVSSGRTQIDDAIKTKELLLKTGAKILGAVLNNKKMKDNTYYYYGKK